MKFENSFSWQAESICTFDQAKQTKKSKKNLIQNDTQLTV